MATGGEDVTQNLRTVKTVPLALLCPGPRVLEVRGEVYMPKESFQELNRQREAQGEPPFANPRNSGGRLRPTAGPPRDGVPEPGHLRLTGWDTARTAPPASRVPCPTTHWDTLQRLHEMGFRTNPHNTLCHTLDEVEDLYRLWLEDRHDLAYQTDGLVVKVNPFEYQDMLGYVGREPRWALAYKFPAEQALTRLLHIGINVGRTGSLNPYAVLEPVNVGGATVKMATLHNAEDIHRKDIRVGDWVVVERGRRGDTPGGGSCYRAAYR